ncbi:putative secreted protein [Photobacterium aphoticum]|uniref:Putative secreted protein n=1 Tax=Photobacterium aphoticum TaxID=754436 RepID=A0A090QZN8_9GAMM|nr:putative secreted protein [Photobacterium aphoticum]
MKFRTALLALMACGLSFPSLADVNLSLPYQAELVLVNGVEKEGNQPLVLPNGVNQIAFTYRDSLRENGDDFLYTSDVIIVKFTADDEKLHLQLPKLRTGMDGKNFNKTPQVTLVNDAGDTVAFKQDKLMKAGLQFGRDYEKEMVTYNASGKVAAVALWYL